jgi:flagellum-specific peptidoglycan hydrolase FlgJ
MKDSNSIAKQSYNDIILSENSSAYSNNTVILYDKLVEMKKKQIVVLPDYRNDSLRFKQKFTNISRNLRRNSYSFSVGFLLLTVLLSSNIGSRKVNIDSLETSTASKKEQRNNSEEIFVPNEKEIQKLNQSESEKIQNQYSQGIVSKDHFFIKRLKNTDKKIIDQYLTKFYKIAKSEQRKNGIPASISLGLAILSSEFGNSAAAKEGKNQFGILCEQNPIKIGKGMVGQTISDDICYTAYENNEIGFKANSLYLKKNYPNAVKKGINTEQIIKKLNKEGYFKSKQFSADVLLMTIEIYDLDKYNK